MVERVRGNLLDAKVEALVNAVNTVGVMGKGIALQFKQAFPDNFTAYERECDAKRFDIGQVFTFRVSGIGLPHYVINFPTKKHWRDQSRIEYIDAGLAALVEQVRRLDIRSLAVPALGCGHGGLAWEDVYPRIEKAFAALPDVKALVFGPDGAPDPRDMQNRTKRPRVTLPPRGNV
jgi:O-acetyl-ADP-ribose deacetylase (regulator of RNase III)